MLYRWYAFRVRPGDWRWPLASSCYFFLGVRLETRARIFIAAWAILASRTDFDSRGCAISFATPARVASLRFMEDFFFMSRTS
jgi:hypothetical protein